MKCIQITSSLCESVNGRVVIDVVNCKYRVHEFEVYYALEFIINNTTSQILFA